MQEKSVSKNLVLVLVMITSFITPFIGASVNLALPLISEDFGLNAIGMSWVAMSYLLSSAVFLVPMGKLADIVGRKRIFFWGNIILVISSFLCAISPSGSLLIVFRVIQGLGSSMVFATGIALVTSVFPPSERGKAIGLNVTAVYVGLSSAPIIGGFMISLFDWHSLFFVPILIGLPAAIATRISIRTEWAEDKNESFDYLGTLIYIPSMSIFMYGFSQLPDLLAIGFTVIGFIGLLLFVRVELRLESPVLNINLFKTNKLFAFANLAALINYATTFAVTFVLSLYLQYIKGLSPRDAGMILVIQPLIMAAVASWSGKQSDKVDPRFLASSGMAISAIGLLMLTPINQETSTVYLLSTLGVLGLGFGLFSSPNTNSIMGSVEKKYLGLASGTVGTMRLTGQMISMGIAALILHLYVGKEAINTTNHKQFIWAISSTFLVFAVMSVLGIWASLKRGKSNGENNINTH
ncbi:MFS transporter [Tenuifilaceae bacterium CYCD]|nr:MFS transporter [Tenuifilaceae bacterium CYCD]